jgi:hypothetical protein
MLMQRRAELRKALREQTRTPRSFWTTALGGGTQRRSSRRELRDGLLVRMSPKSERHEAAVELLLDWLMHHVDRTRDPRRLPARADDR